MPWTSATSPPPDRSHVEGVGHRVGDVVAARPPVVLEPAGEGQGSVVAGRDAEAVAGHLHGAREAGVEIEGADVVDGDPGTRQGRVGALDQAGGGVDRGRSERYQTSWASAHPADIGDLVGPETPQRAVAASVTTTAAPMSTSMTAFRYLG